MACLHMEYFQVTSDTIMIDELFCLRQETYAAHECIVRFSLFWESVIEINHDNE